MTACTRCKRESCRADQLGRTAMLLGFPKHMVLKITTAQDDCDHHRKQLAQEAQP